MKPGTTTPVSAGTLQGVYRPQVRFYYRNDKYGVLFETLTKPLRCRSRNRAVFLARQWMKTPEFSQKLFEVKERLSRDPGNVFEVET